MADASITGLAAFTAKLQLLKSSKLQEDALKAAGLAALTVDQKTIINQGNGTWPAWSKAYKPKRAHQMLWDTGTLLRSLALGGSGNTFDLSGNTLTIGTNVAYAARQNFGGGGIPARPFFTVTDATRKAVTDAYRAVFLRGLK